jgi:hypothetical protein
MGKQMQRCRLTDEAILRFYTKHGISYRSKVWLGGRRPDSYELSRFVAIRRAGGCYDMPGLHTPALTKAYMSLIKKGYIPCALIRVNSTRDLYCRIGQGLWDIPKGMDIFSVSASYRARNIIKASHIWLTPVGRFRLTEQFYKQRTGRNGKYLRQIA